MEKLTSNGGSKGEGTVGSSEKKGDGGRKRYRRSSREEEEEKDLIRDACRPTICSWVERKGAGAKKSPR